MNQKVDVKFFLSEKFLQRTILVVFIFSCLGTFFLGNATFVDVIRGYVSADQFASGEAWNTLNFNLESGKVSYFLSWWTPGQYVLPNLIRQFGVPIYLAQGVLITLFTGVSVLGFFKLFRYLGFSRKLTFLSILIIQTNHLFFWNTLMYFGGSLFEIALLPFLLFFVLQLKESFTTRKIVLYVLISIGLFFLKATFLIHVGIGLAVLLFNYSRLSWKSIVSILIAGLLILSVCYFGYLSFGVSPSNSTDLSGYNGIPNNFLLDFTTPFSSVLGVGLSIGTLLQKIIPHLGAWVVVSYALFLLLASLGIVLLIKMYSISEKAKSIVIYSLLFFVCFLYFYITDKAISYDMRHFAPLAFVFVPFVLVEINRRLKWKKMLQVMIIGLIGFNLSLAAFERFSFWKDMEEINGMYHLHSDATAIYNMNLIKEQAAHNTLYLIMDNWNLLHSLKGEKVLPIYKKEENFYLKSGIETDADRSIEMTNETIKNDALIVYIPVGQTDLIKKIYAFDLRPIDSNKDFLIFSGNRIR